MASAATTTATTPQSARGPLSHIVDALRLDNRQLLLETLIHDPRLGDVNDDNNGADFAAGAGAATAGDGGHDGPSNWEQQQQGITNDNDPQKAAASVMVEQQLIFGSADLRRTILRQIMYNPNTNKDSLPKKKKGKKNKNLTHEQEEEEIIKDWNDEMKQQQQQQRQSHASSAYKYEMKIVNTSASVLSPSGDGTLLSPYTNRPIITKGGPNKQKHQQGFNPFGNADGGDDDSADNDNVPSITTYILRGGGFDLPSLSAAALHRRRVLASKSSSRQQSQQLQQQQEEKVFRFIFVPRMTELERSFLNELGVVDHSDTENHHLFGNASVGMSMNSLESLPIDLIPLDDDVLSLELTGGSSGGSTGFASSMMNEGDKGSGSMSSVPVGDSSSAACMRHSDIEGCEADVADIVARSLMKLQLLNRVSGGDTMISDHGNKSSSMKDGAIGRVQGLGPLATAVIDRMMTLRLEEERMMEEAQDSVENEGDAEQHQDGVGGDIGMEHDEDMVVTNAAGGVEITTGGTNNNTGHESASGMGAEVKARTKPPYIQALLVIDRKIDLITPMLTPLTYEGLIDDVLQIQVGGCVSVKKSIVEPDDDDDEDPTTKHHHPTSMMRSPSSSSHNDDPNILVSLNDSDPLYKQVRDLHVETFGSFLQNQAKALRESHSQFTNRETARDLTEIHQFVKQIPVFTRNLRSLTNHIHIAELVKKAAEASTFRQRWQTERSMLESEPCYETLEDLIASGEPPYRWLRLFCLQSLTSNGIKATRYDSLRKEVVQTYGYEYLMVLSDLEKAGLLRKRETFFMDSMATPYSTLRKALNLIVADVDPSNPEDAAYVSSGYTPMTVRWVQAAMRGYTGLDEAMKELPAAGGVGVGSGGGGGGRWVDIEQHYPPESLVEALKRKRGPSLGTLAKDWSSGSGGSSLGDGSMIDKKPVMLVYFVGGVTFMELAALRFLSRLPSFPYTIVCCTTEIVNGGTLLRSLSC